MPSSEHANSPLTVVVFQVEFEDGVGGRVPIACRSTDSLADAVAALNRRVKGSLGIGAATTTIDSELLDLRRSTGEPLRDMTLVVSSLVADHASLSRVRLLAISNKPSPTDFHSILSKGGRGSQDEPGTRDGEQSRCEEQDESNTDSDDESYDGLGSFLCGEQSSSGGVPPPAAKTSPTAADALHRITMDGAARKVVSKRAVPVGHVVATEAPVLVPAYPMQLAEAVAGDDVLKSRSYDPNANRLTSSLRGVSDDDFTRFVAISVTYGRVVRPDVATGNQVAFHKQMLAIPHSCAPSCTFSYSTNVPPYTGVLRCAQAPGLDAADDITVLFDAVDRPEFMLLPVDRRHKLLQLRYHFTCRCDRCLKSGKGPSHPAVQALLSKPVLTPDDLEQLSTADRESTLSGAIFGEGVEGQPVRSRLAGQMRDRFAALGIVDPSLECSLLVKDQALRHVDPAVIEKFIAQYSDPNGPLTLHQHHWRLSLARHALLRRVAGSASHGRRSAPLQNLSRQTYRIAVAQLATEAVFLPPGHVHRLPTYRSFRRLVAGLPERLAAEVQKEAIKAVPTDWAALQALHHQQLHWQ